MMRAAVALVVAITGSALAQPPGSALPPPLTAAAVANAPTPGHETGRTDPPDRDSAARRMARVLLYIPRMAIDAVLMPAYCLFWAEDRYHLDVLYYRVFFNRDRTIGLYPTGTYSTGYGVSIGARFVDTNLAGRHEAISLQATTGDVLGSPYHESVDVSMNTGQRLGRVQLGTDESFDRRPNDPFYGIGNANLARATPAALVDPLAGDIAISTNYRYQELRASGFADVRVIGPLHVRANVALADHELGAAASGGPSTEAIYDPHGLVGWPGFSNLYGELELRVDTRRRATLWEPAALHAEGWLLAADVGRVHELGTIGPDFWRGMVELQDFWRIARGPRLLAVRLRGEAVSGSTAAVPFVELPMLGGGDFLRGYDFQRFRDRVAVLGSIEYVWDLAHWVDAALFVDAGRVYDSLADVTLDHVRVGYGVALELYSDSSFLLETSIASSIDGGCFFNLSFNPVFDARPRWR